MSQSNELVQESPDSFGLVKGEALLNDPLGIMKSRKRVSDHGEVFTPDWLVRDMLNLVKEEVERIDSRFLEPACGEGNFLKPVLARKLDTARARYGRSEFEFRHHALFGLMCIYGIELLSDNAQKCREGLLEIFIQSTSLDPESYWAKAAANVLKANILQGDALTLTVHDGSPIVFPEWAYLGSGKFQRRDFRYDSLTQRSALKGTLFESSEDYQIFIPVKSFPPITVEELSQ